MICSLRRPDCLGACIYCSITHLSALEASISCSIWHLLSLLHLPVHLHLLHIGCGSGSHKRTAVLHAKAHSHISCHGTV